MPLCVEGNDHACHVAPFAYQDNTCEFCREGVQTSCRHGGFLPADGSGGGLQPGRVFDRTITLDQTPDGYRAMDQRQALKVLLRP